VTDTPSASASDAKSNAIISNPLSPSSNKPANNLPDSKALIDYKSSPTDTSLINNKIDAKSLGDGATEFRNRMSKHAEEASRTTGVPAHLMLGQAALESGWGKRELKGADGTPSNNLFGIKASGNWDGKVVEATTTEYIHGVKQKRIEKFRAYDSYADSFKDFANMMNNNPRYNKVMANLDSVNGYAQAMQNAGYATDPNYASKLASVIQKVIP